MPTDTGRDEGVTTIMRGIRVHWSDALNTWVTIPEDDDADR